MKVALITDGIAPYVIGGMQKHSFYLAKYFAKQGVEVDLIHYNQSAFDINALDVFTNEEKKYIHSIVINFPSSKPFPGHYVFQSYKYSCIAYNAIKHKLAEYDFIYTKGFSGWKLITEKKKGNVSCCPIGVNFHGYEMFQYAPEFKAKLQQQLLKPFVKKITQQADVVFSYGGNITNIIKSIGVVQQNIIEMPSGVESDFISKALATHTKAHTKFVFLGRAERRKGIIELNATLTKLINSNAVFSIEFIGPIPNELKINDAKIMYHGETRDTKKIKKILSQADVLICPSWSEGFPNVILEAMASGLAIIATNVGAISDMVSEKNGWLIPPFNQKALLTAMQEAIEKRELNEKKEISLTLMQEKFNWDIISKQLVNCITHLSN